jgi:hypothetical protein
VLRSIDVVGPSLVHPASRAQLGDQSDALDFGNVHPFTGATSPSPLRIFEEYLLAGRVSQTKPLIATEAGFHTATAATNDDQPAADERTAAVYTLRTVLEQYADGIRATYLYELLDERDDPVDSQARERGDRRSRASCSDHAGSSASPTAVATICSSLSPTAGAKATAWTPHS